MSALSSALGPIGTILSVVGTVGQMVSGITSARADEKEAARTAKIEAQEAREDAARAASLKKLELRRVLGTQRLAASAGGVAPGVGSPLLLEMETLSVGRKEIEDIFTTGARRERAATLQGLQRQAKARTRATSSLFTGVAGLGSIATRSALGRRVPPKKPKTTA